MEDLGGIWRGWVYWCRCGGEDRWIDGGGKFPRFCFFQCLLCPLSRFSLSLRGCCCFGVLHPEIVNTPPRWLLITIYIFIVTQMQSFRTPPTEIMGDLPPGFGVGPDGVPQIPEGCCISWGVRGLPSWISDIYRARGGWGGGGVRSSDILLLGGMMGQKEG